MRSFRSRLLFLSILALANTLVVSPASAQKKPGGGGSSTECTSPVDFPAFIFYRTNGSSGATYVSDRTGKCVRLLASGIHSFRNAFSFPVRDDDGNATNRGRVVWAGTSADTNNAYLVMDFEVNGTTVTPGVPRVVTNLGPNTPNNESSCCAIDLSRDGRVLFASLLPSETSSTVTHRIGRIELPADLAGLAPMAPGSVPVIYQAPPSPLPGQNQPYSGVTWDLSVDYDAYHLYIVRRGIDTVDELVRLGPGADPELIMTGPRSNLGLGNAAILQPYFPAAELVSGSRRVAFREWIGDTTSSDFHKVYYIDGATGALSEPVQRVYGHGLSWAGDALLGNGYDSRGRATGSVVRIDPVTGGTTALVTGYHPQGR